MCDCNCIGCKMADGFKAYMLQREREMLEITQEDIDLAIKAKEAEKK